MPSLIDQFCPNVHDAAITAATFDAHSGTMATADSSGVVAIQRPGEASPQLIFQPAEAKVQAICLIRDGAMVAVGDDDGSIGVYRTQDGDPIFVEEREGARGRVRAMRGVSLSPEGSKLAAIAADGLLRIWDLSRDDRNAWRGFSGDTVGFGPRGERLLAMDETGQPRLMDLTTLQALYMDKLQTHTDRARFSLDGTMILAAGPAGISLLRVSDGALVGSFATKGGSGIISLLLSPDGGRAAVATQRSIHVFSLPDLEAIDSFKHGAPSPTGAALWHMGGIRVAGDDGLLHGGGGGSLGPVRCVTGFGEHRAAVHDTVVTLWQGDAQRRIIDIGIQGAALRIDRDGELLLARPARGPIRVFRCKDGSSVFDGGPETSGATEMAVGGSVVAFLLKSGGCRWWDLAQNRGFELHWPTAMAVSGGGTWLGVVTPKGAVKILDPSSGEEATETPVPTADVPITHLSFINRSPELLTMDKDGVLAHFDLGKALTRGTAAHGRDVITINVKVDRIWGITGSQYCAVRIPETSGATILWVDIHACEVVTEVTGLCADVWVDPETGTIVEPTRSSAILERNMNGTEKRVLRSLPDGEWIVFGSNGILDASRNAANAMR
jgi:WD40 repeat protein